MYQTVVQLGSLLRTVHLLLLNTLTPYGPACHAVFRNHRPFPAHSVMAFFPGPAASAPRQAFRTTPHPPGVRPGCGYGEYTSGVTSRWADHRLCLYCQLAWLHQWSIHLSFVYTTGQKIHAPPTIPTTLIQLQLCFCTQSSGTPRPVQIFAPYQLQAHLNQKIKNIPN